MRKGKKGEGNPAGLPEKFPDRAIVLPGNFPGASHVIWRTIKKNKNPRGRRELLFSSGGVTTRIFLGYAIGPCSHKSARNHPSRAGSLCQSRVGPENAPCNVAIYCLTNSRRRNVICSGRITVIFHNIASAKRGQRQKSYNRAFYGLGFPGAPGRGSGQDGILSGQGFHGAGFFTGNTAGDGGSGG